MRIQREGGQFNSVDPLQLLGVWCEVSAGGEAPNNKWVSEGAHLKSAVDAGLLTWAAIGYIGNCVGYEVVIRRRCSVKTVRRTDVKRIKNIYVLHAYHRI